MIFLAELWHHMYNLASVVFFCMIVLGILGIQFRK